MKKFRDLCLVCGGATALGLSGLASADLTEVSAPPSDELSHSDIFNQVYGPGFTATSGGSFSNGSVTASRVDDNDDQYFAAGLYDASVKAVFAAFDQTFGYLADEEGLDITPLFEVVGKGFDVVGDGDFESEDFFRFARTGSQGVLASSHERNNPFNADHLVTYRIDGLEGADTTLMLFFEDKLITESDRDFNDLVVQIQTGAVGVVIPSPLALPAGLFGIGALALRRRRNA